MRVFNSNKGQTITEYILLFAVALLIVFKFKDAVHERVQSNGVYMCYGLECSPVDIPPKSTDGALPSYYLLR